jgi:hypothetical protein
VPVIVGLGDGVALPDGTDVMLAVPESEPEDEGLAPREIVAVGVRDAERERLSVDVGVEEGVSVLVAVAEPVGVPEGDTDAVKLEESDTLDVIDALAPFVTEPEGVEVSEAGAVELGDGVTGGVPEGVGVGEPVPVLDDDRETEREREKVELGVIEGVAVPDGLELAVAVALDEAELVRLGGVSASLAPDDKDDVGVPDNELL